MDRVRASDRATTHHVFHGFGIERAQFEPEGCGGLFVQGQAISFDT